jgi:hypothetical protein
MPKTLARACSNLWRPTTVPGIPCWPAAIYDPSFLFSFETQGALTLPLLKSTGEGLIHRMLKVR